MQRHQMAAVRAEIEQGEPLPDAFASRGGYFPSFFVEMIGIGDRTGKLDQVLPNLAEYYEHLVQLRRVFLIGIAWPSLQLLIAIFVIGVLILALGWVGQMTGETTDLLGFGLVGVPGLVKYLTGIGFLVACGLVAYRLLTRGAIAHYLQQFLYRLPGVGPHLRLMSLARLTWSLGLAIDSGADARQSTRLAISASGNPYYQRHQEAIDQGIRQGQELHDAMRATGAFPTDFLDVLEVGEQTGQVAESMMRLGNQYRERAKTTMAGVTLFATICVWGCVGGILILLIFRLFGAYLNILENATTI